MIKKGFVLLPILVIIVLVGALGYFIYQNTQLQKSNGNSTSPSVVPTANLPKPSPTPDQASYQNLTLGFKLTFPSSWLNKYYIVEESNIVHFIYKDEANSKAELFNISVMSPQNWQAAQSGPHSILVKENTNTKRVYTYWPALDNPFETDPVTAQDFQKMSGDVKTIITTFKFTE